jgi:antitoxin component of RelBE/YafQ-DinJ toxin-antitoxin module
VRTLEQVINSLPFDLCIPNAENIAAIEELEAGGGHVFDGSTGEVFATILREKE